MPLVVVVIVVCVLVDRVLVLCVVANLGLLFVVVVIIIIFGPRNLVLSFVVVVDNDCRNIPLKSGQNRFSDR